MRAFCRGLINGAGASSTNLAEYKGGTILGEQLVKAVPEIQQFANVKVEQIVNVGSPNLTLDNLLTLANGINNLARDLPTYVSQAEHGRGWIGHLVRRYHVQTWVHNNAPKLADLGKGLALRKARTCSKTSSGSWSGTMRQLTRARAWGSTWLDAWRN